MQKHHDANQHGLLGDSNLISVTEQNGLEGKAGNVAEARPGDEKGFIAMLSALDFTS